MSYKIHKDFKKFEKFKLPLNKTFSAALNHLSLKNQKKKKPLEGTQVNWYTVGGHKNEDIEVAIIEPINCEGHLPCILFLHGGAFVFESSAHHWNLAAKYALEIPCKVVFVNYRLAPKFPFPYGLEDSYAALLWIDQQAEQLGINPHRIGLCGDSAGGALTAGVALLSRDRKGPKLCYCMYVYPVTNAGEPTESMKNYTDTPLWNSLQNAKMWSMYLNSSIDKQHVLYDYASPLEAKSLVGLPDSYIEVAEFDCLHDEGIQFAERLKKECVNVEIHDTKGAVHGFDVAEKSEVTKTSIQRRIDVLKKVLYD